MALGFITLEREKLTLGKCTREETFCILLGMFTIQTSFNTGASNLFRKPALGRNPWFSHTALDRRLFPALSAPVVLF